MIWTDSHLGAGLASASLAPFCVCWECEAKLGLVLAPVRRLARPIPCAGALSMWTLPPQVEREIMHQLPEAVPV